MSSPTAREHRSEGRARSGSSAEANHSDSSAVDGERISVLIVDDHPVVRAGLVGILAGEDDLAVVGEAASADEAVTVAAARQPDVVLMDLRMPGGDGVQATAGVLAAAPGARVVVLTTYDSDADILRAVEAGAAGYLLKDAARLDLVAAVRAAARGETVLAPSVATRLVDRMRRPQPADALSPRDGPDRHELEQPVAGVHRRAAYRGAFVNDRADEQYERDDEEGQRE